MSKEVQYVVMSDVNQVQAWLFAPTKLRAIAGGSQLLSAFDEEVARLAGANARFSAGGSSLSVFDDLTKADAFARDVEEKFASMVPGARVSVTAPVPFLNFGEGLAEAVSQLEHTKRSGRSEGEPAWMAWARPCQGCGVEAAVDSLPDPDGGVLWLGYACRKRHQERDRVAWLEDPAFSGIEPAQSFVNLVNRRGEGLAADLAIVAADVDGVGEKLRTIGSERDYTAFSIALKSALKQAWIEAAGTVIRSPEGDASTIDLLYLGGDDLLLACRADRALPFILELVERFRQASEESDLDLGLSAAAVISNVGFPFRMAHDIAERLLRNAKAEAKERGWKCGAVDYAIVTESMGDASEILADRVLGSGSKSLVLSGRPFMAASSGARSLGAFKDACEKLGRQSPSGQEPPVARSRLYDMRSIASVRELHSGAVRPAEHDVMQGRQEFESKLQTWVSRLKRTPEADEVWRGALTALNPGAADPTLWVTEAGAKSRWQTPVGDFADGIDLWRQG